MVCYPEATSWWPFPFFHAFSLHSQRVVVTGAGGFIGLPLMHALHAAGAEIVALVVAGRSTVGLDALPFAFEKVVLDDVAQLAEAVRRAAPRFVVHLNAHVSTERSYASLAKTMKWNLYPTIDLLTVCSEMRVDRVILMGSTEEYGQNQAPFDVSCAPDPPSPYAASKSAATSYAHMFSTSFGLSTLVLRPTVVYGPGQSPRMLISMVMHALAEGRVIDVTEGKQTRDFVYVDDVVSAILQALRVECLESKVLNVGSAEVVTVRDCLERIERISGRQGLVLYGARPYINREIYRYESKIDETRAALEWEPKMMLDEGLQRTWRNIVAQNSGKGGAA